MPVKPKPKSFFSAPEIRAQIGVLKQCQYCKRIINAWDYEGDGCCYLCRMYGYGLVAYMVQQSNPKWRWLEKQLNMKQSPWEKGKVFK